MGKAVDRLFSSEGELGDGWTLMSSRKESRVARAVDQVASWPVLSVVLPGLVEIVFGLMPRNAQPPRVDSIR